MNKESTIYSCSNSERDVQIEFGISGEILNQCFGECQAGGLKDGELS